MYVRRGCLSLEDEIEDEGDSDATRLASSARVHIEQDTGEPAVGTGGKSASNVKDPAMAAATASSSSGGPSRKDKTGKSQDRKKGNDSASCESQAKREQAC